MATNVKQKPIPRPMMGLMDRNKQPADFARAADASKINMKQPMAGRVPPSGTQVMPTRGPLPGAMNFIGNTPPTNVIPTNPAPTTQPMNVVPTPKMGGIPTGPMGGMGNAPAPMGGMAPPRMGMKKGGSVKASKMGAVKQSKPSMGSASKRGDGIAQRGKTKGRMV